MALRAPLPGDAAGAAARSDAADRRAGGRHRPRRLGGRRGWCAAGAAWLDRRRRCCRCWCWSRSPPSCRCRRSPRSAGSLPIRLHRRAGCMWCIPSRWRSPMARAIPAAPRGGSTVRFEHVRFTYPGRHRPALADVDFDVPAGATVALVGPSGAGKTTIANLLLRFWDPEQGRHPAGRRRPARADAGWAARAHRAGRAGHLPVQRHAGGECPPRQTRCDARGDRNRAASGRAGGVRCRSAGWACGPAWASAACSCPAASVSASRSRAPS